MKKRKVLFAAAFALAITGAFAFKSDSGGEGISALYKNQDGDCSLTGTTNESNCNPMLTSGTQCTINVAGNPAAFKNGSCDALYHP